MSNFYVNRQHNTRRVGRGGEGERNETYVLLRHTTQSRYNDANSYDRCGVKGNIYNSYDKKIIVIIMVNTLMKIDTNMMA